jgi:hypothetical protein
MDSNNHKAILCHIRKGAVLRISNDNRIASVLYPGDKDVPVNADAAVELVENGVLSEVEVGTFTLAQNRAVTA